MRGQQEDDTPPAESGGGNGFPQRDTVLSAKAQHLAIQIIGFVAQMIYATSSAANDRFQRAVFPQGFDELDGRSPLHLGEADCDSLYGV